MDDRNYNIQLYNNFVQAQVQSYQQIAQQAAQAALQANISFAHAQNVKLTAIKNFEDLLASQKIGQQYNQQLLDVNQAKAIQNVWALRKSADVNSRLLDEQGAAIGGKLQAQTASSGVVANKGSAASLQTQVLNETSKLKSDNYREHVSAINKGIEDATSIALEKVLSNWNFEQQQDFMKRTFVESL